jgi:hypothetical protein
MVCLGEEVLVKGREINEFYDTPRHVSEMSDSDIIHFLQTYGHVNDDERYDFRLPSLIASPITGVPSGKEYKTGFTGDVIKFGCIGENRNVGLFSQDREYVVADYISGGALFERREIQMDTYFNKVLTEAWEREIIRLRWDSPFGFLEDIYALRMQYQLTRDSVRNRGLERTLGNIGLFEERSQHSSLL